MQPQSVCDVLNRFLYFGLSKGCFYAVQTHSVDVMGSICRLHAPNKIGMLSNGHITLDEYLSLLDEERYSVVFPDGAIAYIECTFEDSNVENHRFFYIPSPFGEKSFQDVPDDIALSDWLRMVLEDEGAGCVRSAGVIRFDCVRGLPDTVENHPVSHLTLISGDCRIPIRGPLHVSAFFHFVFDHFQRDLRQFWLSFSSYLNLGETEITIRPAEAGSLHLHWETV